MLKLLFCLTVFLLLSCSRRVLEVVQPHYFHDNYFLFRENGHYSGKMLVLGVFRLPDFQRGQYVRQKDSIYFLQKQKKNLFTVNAYGFIDTAEKIFYYRPVDTTGWTTYFIREMPTRKRDRAMHKPGSGTRDE
jgi:hypothetical protein